MVKEHAPTNVCMYVHASLAHGTACGLSIIIESPPWIEFVWVIALQDKKLYNHAPETL